MNNTIWKFEIKGISVKVEMPVGAEILKADHQLAIPCLWALVSPQNETETRLFETHGTGHTIPSPLNRRYIDTFQLRGGELVYHVFEVIDY